MSAKIKNLFHWLDQNLLFTLTIFLWVFIPLFPKLPLLDAIPGYIVKIRLEDVFILITALVWLIQFLRGKLNFIKKTIFFWIILAYGIVGILSIISGILLLNTIPLQTLHIGKSALTYFRYLEYFSLFIFAFSSIRTRKQIKLAVIMLVGIIFAIFFYGLGQKYSGLPVYSTMNREFSKGVTLQLGENARVQSTFGGHYDMAAFLVITLPILFALTLTLKKIQQKFALILAQGGGIWLLLVGASKTSFIAYLIANFFVFIFYLSGRKFSLGKIFRRSLLFIPALIFILVAVFIINPDMGTKLITISRKIPVAGTLINKISPLPSDEAQAPDDFFLDGPIYEEVEIVLPNGDKGIELREKEFEFSRNALKYGLSMGIRLDTLWPQAVTGFRRNIFLGASYGNLNKGGLSEFTESDSTDNNFLRVLGEIGLLGFALFFGLIFLIWKTIRNISSKDDLITGLKLGYLGGVIGILINALYIDVFAASKVAFTFWAISGISLKAFYLENKQAALSLDSKRFADLKGYFKKFWPFLLAFAVFALLTYRNPYMEHKSLTVKLNYQGEEYRYLTLAKCIVEKSEWSLCRKDAGGISADIKPLYSLIIAPVYMVLDNPHAFYFVNFTLASASLYLAFKILQHLYPKSSLKIFPTLLALALLPTFRALTFKTSPYNLLIPLLFLAIWIFIKRSKKRIDPPKLIFPVLTGLLLFATLILFIKHPDPLLKDFSEGDKTNVYRMVFATNSIMNRTIMPTPYLITAQNPYIIDIYSNGKYKLLPFSKDQQFFDSAKQVWGDHDYSNLTPLYQRVMADGSPLYLSDYLIPDFKNLRKEFGITVNSIECEEKCSVYSLSTPSGLPETIEPITFNKLSVGDIAAKSKFSLIVFGHNFANVLLPSGEVDPLHHMNFTKNLLPLLNENADLMVMMGDTSYNFNRLHMDYWQINFVKNLTSPLILVRNTDHKQNPALANQNYKVGQNYFININFKKDQPLDESGRIYLYNIIYQLEFSDVKNVFIFNHDDLRSHPDFQEYVIPRLRILEEKVVYIVSGDDNPATDSLPFLDSNENIFFINTGYGSDEIPWFVRLTIDENNQVEIKEEHL